MTHPRASKQAAILVLALIALPLLAGCGDDGGPATSDTSALVGTWEATSFTIAGLGDILDGTNVAITLVFTQDTYSLQVSGDDLGTLCGTETTCTESGSYTRSGNTLTFDPGTQNEIDFALSLSGDTLTMNGSIDASSVMITAQRT
ncbi:MAG: lipocalin family protein [Gemmatimonadales bacterium]|jgi:hypothetical protein